MVPLHKLEGDCAEGKKTSKESKLRVYLDCQNHSGNFCVFMILTKKKVVFFY